MVPDVNVLVLISIENEDKWSSHRDTETPRGKD